MTSGRPTLKTISELSGFAVPTVSRALKDAPDLSAATKARVRQIAAEIGYVPNRAGVRLRTGRTNVVSLVLSNELDAMDDLPGRLIGAVAQGLRGTPYHLIVTPCVAGEDPLDPIRHLVETRSADAIIMAQIEYEDARVAFLLDRGVPFATLGRARRCAEHAYFDFDNHAFGAHAVRRLAGCGRRRILALAPPPAQSYGRHMLAGARAAMAELGGMTLEVLAGATSHDTRRDIEAALTARLAATAPPVDGIIAPSTTAAIAAVVALEQRGQALGRDIDLVAKEPSRFLSSFRGPIMAVREDPMVAGRFLARAAMQAIEQPGRPPAQLVETAPETRG